MAIDPFNFAKLLAAWLATETSLQYEATPRALWVGQAIEGADCAATYSVLTPYAGGSLQPIGRATIPLQVKTVSDANVSAASDQAAALFDTLLDGLGRPLQQLALVGFKVIAFA